MRYLGMRVVLLTFAVSGCVAPGTDLVRDQASVDLACPPEQLHVTHDNSISEYSDDSTFGATGCGRLAHYTRTGPGVHRTSEVADDAAPRPGIGLGFGGHRLGPI